MLLCSFVRSFFLSSCVYIYTYIHTCRLKSNKPQIPVVRNSTALNRKKEEQIFLAFIQSLTFENDTNRREQLRQFEREVSGLAVLGRRCHLSVSRYETPAEEHRIFQLI